jgi:hypothetical protein
MHVQIKLDENDVKTLVANEITRLTGQEIDVKKVHIQVKAAKTYGVDPEWTTADFRVIYDNYDLKP